MPNTYIDREVETLIVNKMTQAQYDALPEKSNTELYLIDDGEGSLTARQMRVMPEASESYLNRIVQFVGNSTMTYITGYFYRCVLQGGSYIWKKINVQANQGGGGGGQEIQFDDLPEPTSENVGQILQYVGETIPDVCEKGYFYINQFTESDPELTMEQTGGPVDSISFETVSGNITISGTVDAIRNLYRNYLSGMPKGGTITITYGTPYQSTWWNFAIHDESGERNYPGTQSTFENNGFTFTGTPTGGEEIECTYTVGNIYNIQFDENQFKSMEDPTPGDTFVFTAGGNSPMSAAASVEYSEDPELTVSIDAETYHQFALGWAGDEEIVGDQFGHATLEYHQDEDWEDEETGEFYPGESYWTLINAWDDWIDWIEPEDVGISIISGYTAPGDVIEISFTPEGEAAWSKDGSQVSLEDYGIYYEGFAREGDEISVSCTAESGYEWKQINVQPASGGSGDEDYPTIPMYTNDPIGTSVNGYIDFNLGALPDGNYQFFMRGRLSNDRYDQWYENWYAWGIKFIIRNGEILTESNFNTGDSKHSFYYPKPEWAQCFSDQGSGEPGFITRELSTYPWSAGMIDGNAHICSRYVPQGYFEGIISKDPIVFVSKIKNRETNQEYDVLGIEIGTDGYAKYGESNFGRGHSNYSVRMPEEKSYISRSTFWIEANGYVDIYMNTAYYATDPYQMITRKDQEAYYISIRTDTDDSAFDAKIDWDSGVNVTILKATGIFSDSYIGYLSNDYWKNLRVVVHNNANEQKYCCYTVTKIGTNRSVSCWAEAHADTPYIEVSPFDVGSEISSIDDLGTIKQYKKETTADYINGYFYKASGTIGTIPESMNTSNENPNDCTITITDKDGFLNALANSMGWSLQDVKNRFQYYNNFYIYYDFDQQEVTYLNWDNTTSTSIASVLQYITVSTTGEYTGSVSISFNIDFIPEHIGIQNPHWEQINVQPGSSPSYPSTMPVLLQDNWEEDQETGELVQTISNISEVHANSVVIVAPAPTSTEDYANNEVLCIGQGEGSLTFKCATIPNNDITVNVICL